MKRLIFNAGIIFLTLSTINIEAKETLKPETLLRELTSAKVVAAQDIFKDKSLVVFFRPNCSACVRLISQLQCIEGENKIILIGFDASEAELLREYLKLGVGYPAFKTSSELMKHWKLPQNISPQFVLTNKVLKRLYSGKGYVTCKKLRAALLNI